MSDDGLGIAIGDVSGKGIPAALLMATLRAFLRGQAIDRDTDLSAVVANLNRVTERGAIATRRGLHPCQPIRISHLIPFLQPASDVSAWTSSQSGLNSSPVSSLG